MSGAFYEKMHSTTCVPSDFYGFLRDLDAALRAVDREAWPYYSCQQVIVGLGEMIRAESTRISCRRDLTRIVCQLWQRTRNFFRCFSCKTDKEILESKKRVWERLVLRPYIIKEIRGDWDLEAFLTLEKISDVLQNQKNTIKYQSYTVVRAPESETLAPSLKNAAIVTICDTSTKTLAMVALKIVKI